METVTDFIFLGSKITADAMKLRFLGKKSYEKPRQHIKKQRHHFSNKGPYSQSYVFSSSHVQIWELDHKEGWVLKNWCLWTVVLEMTLENLLDIRRSNLSILKEINLEYSLEGLMLKHQYFGYRCKELTHWKRPDAEEDWRQEEKEATADKMVRWHHWLNGQEFEQALGDSEGQGSLACCSPWGLKELDTT